MKVQDAVNLVNRTIFRPGWKLSAKREQWSVSDLITVGYAIDTVNTSYVNDRGEYTEKVTLNYIKAIDVRDIDAMALLRLIVEYAQREIDTHEDREFLRVRQADGSYRAPFHPHRTDGDAAWDQAAASSYAPSYRSFVDDLFR